MRSVRSYLGISFRSGTPAALAAAWMIIGPAFTADADVELKKLAEFEQFEVGGIFSIGEVVLDDGVVAFDFIISGGLPAMGFYTGPAVGQISSVINNTTVPPGYSTPCWYPRFGHMSAGRIFFYCQSEEGSEPGMEGTYVWADGDVTALVHRASGVPGCDGPFSGSGFGQDSSEVSDGRIIAIATAIDEPTLCSSASIGDPSGVAPIFESSSQFPAEFGQPYWIVGVTLDGGWAASVMKSTEQKYGIFVDRGQGLEMWAHTGPTSPEFNYEYVKFGSRIRFSRGRLAFQYELAAEPGAEFRDGLAVADGNGILFVVDNTTQAPGSPLKFQGGIRNWTHTARGVTFVGTPMNDFPGIYNWKDGVLVPIAIPGMVLPGSDSPIQYANDLAASDELIVFWARHLDGSASVYAHDGRELNLVASTRDPIDGQMAWLFDLEGDAGVDGRQLVFKAYSNTGKPALYLATVDVPVPVSTGAGIALLVSVLGSVAAVRLRCA